MVVLTDGNYSNTNPVPAAVTTASQGIIIHTITFGDGADQSTMQEIAVVGSGQHYHADTADDLTAIFQEIVSTLPVLVE